MTVASTTNTVQYTGDATTKPFGFANPFFATTDLVVTLFDTSANIAVTPAPVLNGAAAYDYIVTGTQDPKTGEYLAGATVTFNTAPLGNHRITIQRNVPATQQVALTDNAQFPAKTVEGALDRLTMLLQQQTATQARAIVAPASDPLSINLILPAASVRASNGLAFDASGNIIVGALTSTVIAAAMLPVVQAPTIAAALTVLGLTAVLRDYQAGRAMTNDGVTPNTKVNIGAGLSADDSNSFYIAQGTSALDCTTVGANGLDAGSLGANQWWAVYDIAKAAGTVPAVLASQSFTAPTLPSGYTLKRLIGAFLTDGVNHILPGTWDGDWFWLKTPIIDINSATNTTVVQTVRISVPPLAVLAAMDIAVAGTAAGTGWQNAVWCPDLNQPTANSIVALNPTPPSTNAPVVAGQRQVRTNASGQIKWVSNNTTGTFTLQTLGYLFPRGRFN